MSVSPAAVLGGLLILTSFVLSPATITVPGTDRVEPALIWLTISMPTGSRKTTIYQFMRRLLQEVWQPAKCSGLLTLLMGVWHNTILIPYSTTRNVIIIGSQ